jgi:iron complex outermembrane receptor protein
LVQQDGRWRITEFVRIDNVTDKNYVGSVIVNEGNTRYYEPSPRRNMTIGVQANLRF